MKQNLKQLEKPCSCGNNVWTYKIRQGAYKGIYVAVCDKCDIEYYYNGKGKMIVIS